jgi:hypothetical protein
MHLEVIYTKQSWTEVSIANNYRFDFSKEVLCAYKRPWKNYIDR